MQHRCYYAATAPDRIVHAVDPDARNIEHMRARYERRRYPNLRPLHAGLSNESSSSYSELAGAPKIYTPSHDFPVYALDDLFGTGGAWAGDTLAFAHFDVEGLEELVLAGAARTVARDQPVLTTELTVHKHPERTRSLLALMERWGYDTLLVEEIAGNRVDIRNCIHLPRSRRRQVINSNTLDLGVASRALIAVTADSVNRTAFPCCAAGGECCPRANEFECCSHGAVHAWMNRVVRARSQRELAESTSDACARSPQMRHGGADLALLTRTRWYDEKYQGWKADLTPHWCCRLCQTEQRTDDTVVASPARL